MSVHQFEKAEKKRRTNENTSMNEEEKVGVIASDKGSYYQKWTDDSDSEMDEAIAIGSSRQTLESKVERFCKT